MTLGTFDAVIFDFDGTLADSHAAMMRAYQVWADEFGIDHAVLGNYTGMPSEAVARAVLPEAQVATAAPRIEELEIADTDGVIALPGAYDALRTISDARRAIATSCTSPLLTARLAATQLPQPAVVVTRDQVANGKPAPDSFLLAAERLGVDPARCLVCEDAPAGVQAARAAGMAVLGLTTNHTVDELQADWHAATLAEVTFDSRADGVVVSWAAPRA